MAQRKRVLSGMRPTGRLHIGHYFGALQNWLKFQDDPQYESFFFIADWHALTTDYADTTSVPWNTIQIATDWLASGLDPDKCTMFVQSTVREHSELHLLLSMVTPLSWLERVPTYKEAIENIKAKDLHTYGFLGYPVLQSADIVMYGEPGVELLVPVGEDQVSHVELTREIVRKMNGYYGLELRDAFFALLRTDKAAIDKLCAQFSPIPATPGEEPTSYYQRFFRHHASEIGITNFLEKLENPGRLFVYREALHEPEAMLTETPRIPGTDGRKMSKSYNNFISLSEADESIRTKVRAMMTDPARKRRQDPGNPDVCPVFHWHKLFPEEQTQEKRARVDRVSLECRTAAIGCVECKSLMADALVKWIEPVRERREQYAADPGKVLEIVNRGSERARSVAKSTMARVRESVFGWEKVRANLMQAAETPVDAGTTDVTSGR